MALILTRIRNIVENWYELYAYIDDILLLKNNLFNLFFYRNTHRVLVQMGSWWCLTVRRVSANAAVIQIWYIIHIRYLQIPAGRSKTTYLTLKNPSVDPKGQLCWFSSSKQWCNILKKTMLHSKPLFQKKICNLQTVDRGQKLS